MAPEQNFKEELHVKHPDSKVVNSMEFLEPWSTSFAALKTLKKQPNHGVLSYLPAIITGYEKQSQLI
jgi:hypothetical protein